MAEIFSVGSWMQFWGWEPANRSDGSAVALQTAREGAATPTDGFANPTREFGAISHEERHARITQRAYEIWQARGCQHGQDEENWSAAERQIDAEIARHYEDGRLRDPRK